MPDLNLKNAHDHIVQEGKAAVAFCGWYYRCLKPWETTAPSALPSSYRRMLQEAVDDLLLHCSNRDKAIPAIKAMKKCTVCLQQLSCYLHCDICHNDAIEKCKNKKGPGAATPRHCSQRETYESMRGERAAGACVHLNNALCEQLRRADTYPNLLLLHALQTSFQDLVLSVSPEECKLALISLSDKCKDPATAFLFWLYVIWLKESGEIDLDFHQVKILRGVYREHFAGKIFGGQKVTPEQLRFGCNKEKLFEMAREFMPPEIEPVQLRGHIDALLA